MLFPETDPELLARLKDPSDQRSWHRFVELYRPALLGFAHRKGLQASDAEDLAQEVLAAVAVAVGSWRPDRDRGRFSTWLFAIAHRKFVDAVRSRRRLPVTGGSSLADRLTQVPERQADSLLLKDELRRQMFQLAARDARESFSHDVWDAFRLTALEAVPAAQAAAMLGKSVGAVYAARARVMRRIAERVRELEFLTGDLPIPNETCEAPPSPRGES